MKKLFFILALFAYTLSANASSLSLLSSNIVSTELHNDDKDKKSCCKKGDNKEKCCKKDGESNCKKADGKDKCLNWQWRKQDVYSD